jgi:hypothetical protein
VGLPTDAIVHISEISDRYVRDARELLSVGQIVRARIIEVGGARLSLSFKNVPPPEHEIARREAAKAAREGGRGPRGEGRAGDGPRGERGGRGGGGRGGRQDRPQREPERPQNTRAVQSKPQSRFGGPKRGGPGGRGDKRDERGPREEYVRLEDVAPKPEVKNNPFANFFKKPD